jgi:hypothetical protein
MPKKDTKFKKGNPGGPGRPPLSKEAKKANKLSRTRVKTRADRILEGDRATLKAVLEDPESTNLEIIYAKAALKSMKDGNLSRIEPMVQRSVGKVKDDIVVEMPEPLVIKRFEGDADQVIGHRDKDQDEE